MAERTLALESGRLVEPLVYQSTSIEFGKMVSINAAGYAIEAALTAGTNCLGVCRENADNSSGASGDISVQVETEQAAWMSNSTVNAVDLADIGKSCYVEDDETVRDYVSAGVNVRAGRVLAVNATDGVLVFFDTSAGDVYAAGDLEVGGKLDVVGATTLASVDVTGNATCADLDPTGDISMDAGKAISVAADGVLVVPYEPIASGGAPTQAEMVAGFGAAADGKLGIFADTGGVLYLCAADAALTWHYVAMTVGA